MNNFIIKYFKVYQMYFNVSMCIIVIQMCIVVMLIYMYCCDVNNLQKNKFNYCIFIKLINQNQKYSIIDSKKNILEKLVYKYEKDLGIRWFNILDIGVDKV